MKNHWILNPEVDFLNHGSFGAVPREILAHQQALRTTMERDPVEFLAPERTLESRLDAVRDALSTLIHAPSHDLAFVRNATDGVGAVLNSFPWRENDEIVITDHGYNACNNAARYAAERAGANVRVARVPFPLARPDEVTDAVCAEFTDRTRLLVIDHITSPTALVLPLHQIIPAAHAKGIRVLVDGAHALGQVPIDLHALNADYYTANHHKWHCAPKASAFLYVRPEWQHEVRPNIISHGANRTRPGRTRFLSEFDWMGTFDPTPLLCVPKAIEFLSSLYQGGMDALMHRNRQVAISARDVICQALGIRVPAPESMVGSMISIPIPETSGGAPSTIDPLEVELVRKERIEVPVFNQPGCGRTIRVSIQAYNSVDQVKRLAEVLSRALHEQA